MTIEHDADVRFLMGNEAIARGIIEAGCGVAAAYPGTPSSEVLESLVRWKKELGHPIYLEWSVNEKVAFEVAYGASLAGARAVAAMKMVGLNVASDPFMSVVYLGVRGGLVVVVADDPGPHSSQTEQDSRFFGWFAKVPVLDPGIQRKLFQWHSRRLSFQKSTRFQYCSGRAFVSVMLGRTSHLALHCPWRMQAHSRKTGLAGPLFLVIDWYCMGNSMRNSVQ